MTQNHWPYGFQAISSPHPHLSEVTRFEGHQISSLLTPWPTTLAPLKLEVAWGLAEIKAMHTEVTWVQTGALGSMAIHQDALYVWPGEQQTWARCSVWLPQSWGEAGMKKSPGAHW